MSLDSAPGQAKPAIEDDRDPGRSGASGTRSVVLTSHYFAPHVGGIETVVEAQATHLSDLGWDVTLFTSRLADDPAIEHPRSGMTVRRFRALNPFERTLNVPVPLVSPFMWQSMLAAVRDADVAIAHGHVYLSSAYAAAACRRAGVPLVLVQHSPWVGYPHPIDYVERAVDRTLGRRVLESADVVVCVSGFTEDFVRSIAPRARTVVIPNGVDTVRFAPDPAPRHEVRPLRVVTVRRLVPRTGVDLLIEAWRRSGMAGRAELIIGGVGPLQERLERQAEGLEGVRFLGRVTHDDLPALYRSADVAVMPTRTGEGFGLMAAEAMACGTPVVVTGQGALPELVRDGVDGIVCAPNDPGDLARCLALVLSDDALRGRLAAGARARDLTWAGAVERFDALLRDVAAGVRRR
jgi:glycosyltransferase involved in cell wall biosynthesis